MIRNLLVSVATQAVGDTGQESCGSGDVAAVAVSGGVGCEIVLRAGLLLVAGDLIAGIKVERVGGPHTIAKQTEGRGLSVVRRFLISFVILVDGGGLNSGAVGVIEQG